MSITGKSATSLLYWFLIAGLILVIDFVTGPLVRFPVTYLIPIVLAAWYSGRRWGIFYAVTMPVVRFGYDLYWTLPDPAYLVSALDGFIHILVFIMFAILVSKVQTQKAALELEVKTLEGLLPICSFCKKIRNENGKWEQLESFITRRSEAQFSHGVCPKCGKEHYPELGINWGE